MKKVFIFSFVIIMLFAVPLPIFAANVANDTGRFTYGAQRIFLGVFELPLQVVKGTFYGPPVIGTVSGALSGTFLTFSNVMGGAFDMAAASAPYAKYALLA